MTRALILPAALMLPMLLAACSQEPAPAQDNGRAAAGEVLEGSISDEMIAYDRLRSQPPLAELQPGEEGAAPEAAATPGDPAGDAAVPAGEGAAPPVEEPPAAAAE